MTTITVPAKVPALEPMEATPAASAVTTSLRGGAIAAGDVCDTMRAKGAPPGWTGDASIAADHAMTRFGRETDAVVAALEKAVLACDVYVDQVVRLTKEHADLESDRGELNNAIDALMADIDASTGDDVPALEARAQQLLERSRHLTDQIAAFWQRVRDAEDRLVRALGAVDDVSEGRSAATRDGRADTAALRRELAALGRDATAVNAWWASLSPAEREALKISDPDLVGNTNGIPTGDRDEANRGSLDRDLDRLRGLPADERSDAEQALLDRAEAAEQALAIPGSKVDRTTGLPVDVNLLVYQPGAFGGDGAVAVGFGDPDTADNTAVIVPGITNDGTTIPTNAEDAFRLFERSNGAGESSATIAWMGYDAPSWRPQDALDWPGDGLDMGSVVREDKAVAGGALLADFVDGLRATDEGDRSHLSVIGHSYGSTTASHAAHGHGLAADSLTLIGSPGAGGDAVDHARDLGMPAGRVYAGAADNDFVSWLGRDGDLGMGQDPTQATFGATRFPVDPGAEFHAETIEEGVANHTSYFDEGSASLGNLVAITRGDEPTVISGRTEAANDMALDWARDEAVHQVEKEIEATRQEIERGVEQTREWGRDRWQDVQDAWPW